VKKTVRFEDLGTQSFSQTWSYQEQLFDAIVQRKFQERTTPPHLQTPTTDHLLFVEHPHVYTLGKSGKASHLLISEAELTRLGASYFPINRGGDITYHGPGQLVGYPILNLDHFFTDIHKYLRYLEEVIILTLADYGLHGERSSGETGVWLETNTPRARKICAMGVRASRWVTMHGFALNANTDLSYFNHIVPCGIADKQVASLHQELGRPVDMAELKNRVKHHFESVFGVALT
jgi:lipoyl(octanoyl) transferase